MAPFSLRSTPLAKTTGDTVLVADGTHKGINNRDLDFNGKDITVKSEFGPEACFIDCGGTTEDPHRGFFFHSGESSEAVVEGFTIMNGETWPGAAIYCEVDSNPTIRGNLIQFNNAVCPG